MRLSIQGSFTTRIFSLRLSLCSPLSTFQGPAYHDCSLTHDTEALFRDLEQVDGMIIRVWRKPPAPPCSVTGTATLEHRPTTSAAVNASIDVLAIVSANAAVSRFLNRIGQHNTMSTRSTLHRT